MKAFPSREIARKHTFAISLDNTALSSPKTVAATKYGVIYSLWVSVDVAAEGDLDNLVATMTISVTIGSTVWSHEVHPFIADGHATQMRTQLDLGPWSFDFGRDGFYSGVRGEDLAVAVAAAGTGIKSMASYLYSGD